MGFAQGLRAGSDAAERAFSTYYATKDRRKRDEEEAAVKAELSKLDTPQQALVMPKAEFTAEGVQGMQGFDLGSQATGAAKGLQLSAMPQVQAGGFDAGNVAPTPRELSMSEREAVYGNIARIKGDIAGMRQSDQNRAALKVKDAFSRYMKEFDADDGSHVDMAIRQLNTTDGVVTIGDPDKKGYRELSFVDRDGRGRFTRLSRAEQAQLYAAGQMMAEYPEEALARISAVNKELGESLARANRDRIGVTGANNQANNLRNDDIRNDETLKLRREELAANERYRAASLANQRAGLALSRNAQGRQYIIENGDGQRAIFTPTEFDKTGTAMLPPGYRFVQEDGQGRGRADQGLKVNPDGSVIKDGVLYIQDVNGNYKPAKGLGPSSLDMALERFERGGGQALPRKGEAFIGEPTPGFRPASYQSMRASGGSEGSVNPANLERVNKRGLFGGVSYEYVDRTTGKRYSVDEYNQMLSE